MKPRRAPRQKPSPRPSARRVRLGETLRGLREQRNLSQEGLAQAAGISRNFVGMLERGERTATIETLENVCEALQVSPAIVFESGRPKGVTREEKLGLLIASLAKGTNEQDAARFERIARAFFARA